MEGRVNYSDVGINVHLFSLFVFVVVVVVFLGIEKTVRHLTWIHLFCWV